MLPESQIQTISEQMSIPWLTDFAKFDPQTSLSKQKCTVIALNGSNDLQVPPKENLEIIEKVLSENENKDVEIKQLENLNHLFQRKQNWILNEYATIDRLSHQKR